MKTNVLKVAGTSTGTATTGTARIAEKAKSQVMNLVTASGLPVRTAADRHRLWCALSVMLSSLCPPLLAVAAYQYFKAQQTKEGGER